MFYRIDGIDLFTVDVNPGSTETVVFIHGWPLSSAMFEYQFNALSKEGIRCIGVDLPGYGRSDKPYGGYDYESLSELLHKLFKEMNLREITLAGFSMGGGIAAKYAAKYGGHIVKKLILIGAACPSFVKRPGIPYGATVSAADALIADLERDKPRTFSEFGKLVFESPVSPEFAGWFGFLTAPAALLSARKGLETLRDEDLSADLTRINIPTAIFHGVLDRVCPYGLAEETHRRIKGSKLVKFEKSGHDIFYAEKDLLSREIAKFAGKKAGIQSVAVNDAATMTYPFQNLPLKYGYAGLEPFIDSKTMELHHDKHLQKYIDTLNAALAPYPQYHNKTLAELLKELNHLPPEIHTQVLRNAGGAYNHFLYFEQLTPLENAPLPRTMAKITQYFNSFDAFKKELKEAALGVFGSGYAWLIQDAATGDLEIVTTPNQNSPVSDGMTPLTVLDVWEHAYYLKHFNERDKYVDTLIRLIDWNVVESRIR